MQTPAYPRPVHHHRRRDQHRADAAGQGRHRAQRGRPGARVRHRAAARRRPRGGRDRQPAHAGHARCRRAVQDGRPRPDPGAVVDGPLAFDNAVSAAAARTKGIVSEVAGAADILVVPDLESGNMLAKQLEYLGGAASAGIVLGARVPIVLTSRADTREARIASCAVALVAARGHVAARRRASVGPRRSTAAARQLSCSHERRPSEAAPARRRRCRAATACGEPILVLNCGSSSIKFALFDRGASSRCRASPCGRARSKASAARARASSQAASPPVALALDAEKPYPAALQHVRALRRTQTGGRLPAAVAHRVVHGGSKYARAGPRRPCRARRPQELHRAGAAAPAVRAAGDRDAAGRAARAAAGRVLRHRVPPHAAAGRADAAAAARAVGTRHPALRLPRPVVRVHGGRARRSATATPRAAARSSPTSAAAPACARCTGCRASPRRWASPRSTA